jgi:hypothetical protein
MVYGTSNYWVFELRPSSGILENRKHNVSKNNESDRGCPVIEVSSF